MFSAQRFHVAALAAGCCLAVAAETMYTDADGTTYDVTDQVLTIAVPEDTTHMGDYTSYAASGITKIVKVGAGMLDARPVVSYTGDFEVALGCLQIAEAGDLGADGTGTITVKAGGGIWNEGTSTIASGKTIYLAGMGPNNAGGFFRSGGLNRRHHEKGVYELPHTKPFVKQEIARCSSKNGSVCA